MKKILFILVLMISACSWRSPNSKFYMMDSAGLSELSAKKMNIAVARVKVPDLLNRAQIVVYDKNSEQVEILEFNRWGEVLPDVLQATIVDDLIAYLPNTYVKRTYFDSSNMDYNINVEINNIKAYKSDKVLMSVWWNVANSAGKVLKRGQKTYEVKAKGDSLADLITAQNEAVHLLSKDIAIDLTK